MTTQLDRFKESARQAGADESSDALDRAFGKLDLRHRPQPQADDSKSDDKGE